MSSDASLFISMSQYLRLAPADPNAKEAFSDVASIMKDSTNELQHAARFMFIEGYYYLSFDKPPHFPVIGWVIDE